MISDLQRRRWTGPLLWRQPEAAFQQLPEHETPPLLEHTDSSRTEVDHQLMGRVLL